MIAAGRYVAEGRDIGTVVSPDSPLKVFLTASEEERARRRAAQTGEDEAAVLAAQRRRDERDENREHSALRVAADAVEIDTTGLSEDEVVARVVAPRPRAGPGVSRLPTVAVVGFPNVGKSTLVNRLAGGREAVTDAKAGVTRDRKRVRCEWNGVAFELLDTGGIDLADEDELARDIQRQARLGMAEADVVLLVADARAGVRAGDAELAADLRGAEVPVLVVANKIDRPEDDHLSAELHQLGLGEPMSVSASHGLGSGDLLDRVVELLGERPPAEERDEPTRVAVIGRPNAGKSSLVNAFLGSERVIVSERAGTTRDSIDTELEVDGRPVILVDTAGSASPLEGRGEHRLLRPAALRTGGRASRRRARRLRRRRRDNRRGPAGRRAGDAGRLRDPDRPQQVGRHPHRHRRRPRPRHPEAAPAPDRRHLLRPLRAQRRQPSAEGARAGRPRRRANPDPRAQPLRRRRGRQNPPPSRRGPAPAPLLLGSGGRAPAARSRSRSTTAS